MLEFTYRLALRIFRGVPVKKTTLYLQSNLTMGKDRFNQKDKRIIDLETSENRIRLASCAKSKES